MKKQKITVRVDEDMYSRYKKFCKENGLIIEKRLEDLMCADLEMRLIKIPKVKI